MNNYLYDEEKMMFENFEKELLKLESQIEKINSQLTQKSENDFMKIILDKLIIRKNEIERQIIQNQKQQLVPNLIN